MGAEHAGLDFSERSKSPGRKPYTGPPPRPSGEKPVCSIPAKFETILFKGPRERKGFGSEGRRFQEDETDKPGPGRYGGDASASNMDWKHDSIGKRGYGPMASRDTRFRHHRPRYTGPGPGAYAQSVAAFLPQTHNRADTTANFHTEVPKLKPLPAKDENPQPGPGTYNPVGTRVGQKIDPLAAPQSHNSAFKAPGHKLTLSGNVDTPGPTKYSLPDGWAGVGKGGPGGSGSRGGTSSFAGRSLGSLNSNGMAPLAYIMEGAGGPAAKPDTGPGPGAYELQTFKSLAVDLERAAARPSAAFQAPEFVDRWNRPINARQEQVQSVSYNLGGAGAATQKALPAERISSPPKGVSAPFKSQSPGHADYDIKELARAPGPAYYDSKPLAAKSFHVNARKQFIGR